MTAKVLGLVLPLGWLWSRRLEAPLVHLATCMDRIRHADPRTLTCPLSGGDDEIGQLGRCFRAMLAALATAAAPERRVVQAERPAAGGWMAAGVAHEINNPLLTPADREHLLRSRWLGNVRELRHVLERACILGDGEHSGLRLPSLAEASERPIRACAEAGERAAILAALAGHGSQTATAAASGISRKTLWQKMKRYGVSRSGAGSLRRNGRQAPTRQTTGRAGSG